MEGAVGSWLIEIVQQHGSEVLLSIVSLLVGGLIGRWRAWRRLARRAFFDRVNVSLNFVDDGELRIRTLLERSGVEVFRNAEMSRRVMAAARKRDRGALLVLRQGDYWYYLNAVLNAVSEHFAEGFVRQEAGLEASPQTYLLFLTCENEGPVRQHKVRAMLIREALLLETAERTPRFKNEFHAARWNTLREVREEWVQTGGATERIRALSICV